MKRQRRMLAGAGLLLLAAAPAGAAAKDAPTCSPAATLHSYDGLFRSQARSAAAPTRYLPDDGAAVLLFQQGAGAAGAAESFQVFESRAPAPSLAADHAPLPLIAATPAPDAPDPAAMAGFTGTDSTRLQIAVPDPGGLAWVGRTFFIVACDGGAAASWGRVTTRVTDARTAMWICIGLAVATYFFCMLCLRDMRKPGGSRLFAPWGGRENDALADTKLFDKYPSIFKRQQLGRLQLLNPIHLMVNEVGVPSVQKFQVILFSSLVVGVLLYLVLRDGTLSNLSDTVVVLIGISGASAATSNAVIQQNNRLSFDNWAWLEKEKILKDANKKVRYARWSDMVTTNRQFDIYKMQAMVFSLVVAIALLIAGAGGELSTFQVPPELLGVLGLSQVTYIGGILVQPPAMKDLDAALTALRGARESYDTCVVKKTDTDDKGEPIDPPPKPPPAPPAPHARLQYEKLARNIVPMIESTLEVEVDDERLKLPPDPVGQPPGGTAPA